MKTETETPTHPEYMTGDQLAAYLNVSHKAVASWTQRGEIPCVKIGRLNRYPRRTIEKRLLSGRLLKR